MNVMAVGPVIERTTQNATGNCHLQLTRPHPSIPSYFITNNHRPHMPYTPKNVAKQLQHTKRIHKISSVCKYCRCNAAVTTVRMRAEFDGPFGRHGGHLQTIEPRLRIVLCV
jgi:hypothetical protein